MTISCFQCIQIKPIPASNTRPSRLKASCDATSMTMSQSECEHLAIETGLDPSATYYHALAPLALALELSDKLQWGWDAESVSIGCHGNIYYVVQNSIFQ